MTKAARFVTLPWVEALKAVEKQFQGLEKNFKEAQQQLEATTKLSDQKTHIIHIFDREGDIAEVFHQI